MSGNRQNHTKMLCKHHQGYLKKEVIQIRWGYWSKNIFCCNFLRQGSLKFRSQPSFHLLCLGILPFHWNVSTLACSTFSPVQFLICLLAPQDVHSGKVNNYLQQLISRNYVAWFKQTRTLVRKLSLDFQTNFYFSIFKEKNSQEKLSNFDFVCSKCSSRHD